MFLVLNVEIAPLSFLIKCHSNQGFDRCNEFPTAEIDFIFDVFLDELAASCRIGKLLTSYPKQKHLVILHLETP